MEEVDMEKVVETSAPVAVRAPETKVLNTVTAGILIFFR
jgi:hypothetical protein